jgi:hypothetical protein
MKKYFQFSPHTLLFFRRCWTSMKPVTLRFLAMQPLPNEPATKFWRMFSIAIWLRIENWVLRQSKTRSDSRTSGISPLRKPACYRTGNRSHGDKLKRKKKCDLLHLKRQIPPLCPLSPFLRHTWGTDVFEKKRKEKTRHNSMHSRKSLPDPIHSNLKSLDRSRKQIPKNFSNDQIQTKLMRWT